MAQEYYAVDIPGKMLYDKEFSVSIRKITPLEQKYILSLSTKEQRTNKDFIDFIKKLVMIDNPEVHFEDLYWFDVQYILYRIRFATYSKYPVKLRFNCLNRIPNEDNPKQMERCGEEIRHELKIDELKIYTPDDIEGLKTTIALDNLGEVRIRQKIMADDLTIDNLIKKYKIDPEDLQMRLLLLDLCLISKDKSVDELYQAAENGDITAEDIAAIEDWFTHTIWGVKEEVTVKCPKCGKEETRSYTLALEEFFSAV